MTTRRVEVERFSVTSSKPLEAVRAALEAAVGHPDMAEFARATFSLISLLSSSRNRTRFDIAVSGVKHFANLLNRAIGDVLRVDSARTYSDILRSIGPFQSGSAIDQTLLP
jgi:hypothetical protein